MNKATVLSPLDTMFKIAMLVNYMIGTRNQFQLLENAIVEQSNNNELNMAQETTNNPAKQTTLLCRPKNLLNSNHQAQTLPTIYLFHLMQKIAPIILVDLKKHRNNQSKLQKDY